MKQFTKGDYTIITDKTFMQVDVIHQYLSGESYWANNIPLETVQRSIDGSLCFGVFHKTEQVGFARLITDKATFAYLADVFILPAHRGKGLSKWLMQVIQDYDEVKGLRRWMLATRDAHKLYEQFGWKSFGPELQNRFMQRHFPEVYKEASNNK